MEDALNALEKFLESLDPEQRGHIDKQLRAVAAGVADNKRAGTFTLKLTLLPNGTKCTVKHDVNAKVPQPATESRVMWHGKDGELLEEDPKQQRLPLHSVPKLKPVDIQ